MTAAEKVLEEIEGMASSPPPGLHKRGFLPLIGREKGTVLERIVLEKKPKLVLEVGTLVGYSAILMAKGMDKGKIISLEVNPQAAEMARKNIEKAGLSGRIEVIVGDAKQLITSLKGPFDLVFLDAAKEEYIEYLKLAEPKLSPRAVVVADNAKMFAREMKDFLEYVRHSGKYESTFHDFGFDGVEVSTSK